jgi:hypothetical protein
MVSVLSGYFFFLFLTSLPPHETDGCCHPFSREGINVFHEKKVDLGVLRDAES